MAAAKKDYREIADDDLKKEMEGLVKALFNLRVRRVTDVVENPAAFRDHRRRIARIKAVLRERQRRAAGTPAPATGSGRKS